MNNILHTSTRFRNSWRSVLTLALLTGFSTMLSLSALPAAEAAPAQPANLKILCTTFPIWLLTRNITQGRDGLEVQLLLPAAMGCPHDYALTPQDMQKLARAQVLVENGLGLEEFLGAPVRKANAKLTQINASHEIPSAELLNYLDEHSEHDTPEQAKTKPGAKPAGNPAANTHPHAEHSADEAHEHTGINPHLFTSPRLYGQMGLAIAEGLSEADPAGAALYQKNAEAYAAKMNALNTEFIALGKRLANTAIVTQHGVFDYLAREAGIKVVAVVAAHAGQDPSAAEILGIVKEVRKEKAGAIFTEPQYPSRIGQTIAKETGIPTASLDPTASGPDNAGLDYYESIMRQNMEILSRVLGTR